MATDPRLTNLSYGFYIARVRFAGSNLSYQRGRADQRVLEKQYLFEQFHKNG